jgi:CBS domain-containing protein
MEETVDDLMTRNPVCGSRNDSADAILQRMTDGRFRHMPITENGELVGIVTIGDVVAARLEELSMERNALEGMIMGH